MKKLSKEDQYFMEMLDKERKYRAKAGGNDVDEPIMMPLLFRILDLLRTMRIVQSFGLGLLFSILLKLCEII